MAMDFCQEAQLVLHQIATEETEKAPQGKFNITMFKLYGLRPRIHDRIDISALVLVHLVHEKGLK
jgi:hypothetical protein